MAPMIKGQIARLKKPAAAKPASASGGGEESAGGSGSASEKGGDSAVLQRLDKLERLVQEMNDRLKSFETRLPQPKP